MKLNSYVVLISFLFIKSAAPQGGAFWQRPGIDVFPHISYFDQYVNYRHLPETWGGSFTAQDVLKGVKDQYRLLKDAGFTHTVSSADEYSTDPTVNPGLKIFDRHIDWSAWEPMEGSTYPGRYLNSQSQDGSLYPFRIAGELPTGLGPEGNFGFGHTSFRSVWVNNPNPDLTPNWVTLPLKGEDKLVNGEWVRSASPSSANGFIFYSKINRMLFTSYDQLTFFIEVAGGKSTLPDSTAILTVIVKSSTVNKTTGSDGKSTSKPNTEATFTIRFRDLRNEGFKTLQFTDKQLNFSKAGILENQPEVAVYYHGHIPVNIRSFYFADGSYLELTRSNSNLAELKRAITTKLEKYKDHPLFEAFYIDEPYLLTAATRKLYTGIIRSVKPRSINRSLDLSAVTGGYWLWHLAFDRKYSSIIENGQEFYRNFLLFDHYPLKWWVKNGWHDQKGLQKAFDDVIEYRGERLLPRDGKEDPFQFLGFLPAILAAQNLTPDNISDDLPLFQTIQVSGAKQIKRSGSEYSYNQHPLNLRTPTRHEIFAMCNLAIAYGAKGLMYYMVPTRIDPIPGGDVAYNFATYGIFDDPANIYDENRPEVCKQRAGAPQMPNRRYHALQEYIHDLEKIDDLLLRLHWVNAYSADRGIHRVNDRALWINNVTATDADGIKDQAPFVEVGLFRQLTEDRTATQPDSIWLFVVNRLCDLNGENSSEGNRTVTISLKDGFEKGFENYSVIDLTSGEPHTLVENNGSVKGSFSFELEINSGRSALILLKRK